MLYVVQSGSALYICPSVPLSHTITCISNAISPTSWDSDLNWVMMLIILHSFYCFFWLMSICLWAVNIIKTTRILLLCWVMFNSSEKIGGSVSLYTAACMYVIMCYWLATDQLFGRDDIPQGGWLYYVNFYLPSSLRTCAVVGRLTNAKPHTLLASQTERVELIVQ